MKSPYSAAAIANYFIRKNRGSPTDLTHLKIQKLLFFAQGWFMANYNLPLFNEPFEAWNYGPVVRSIYDRLAGSGDSVIVNEISQVFNDENGHPVFGCPQVTEGDHTTISFLDQFWESYHPIHAFTLSKMSHAQGSPWQKTFERYGGYLPFGAQIYDEDIHQYFTDLKNSSGAAGEWR